MITALYADQRGEIYDAPGCPALGVCGRNTVELTPEMVMPLPEGAQIMLLPGREALTLKGGQIAELGTDASRQKNGRTRPQRLAVAAVLPMGYTRTHLPAFAKQTGAPVLPLYGYTAVAVYRDEMVVAAVASDHNEKWHPFRFNTPDLRRKVEAGRRRWKDNRIVAQLSRCSLTWQCCTAQNLFYGRWEAGIPVSPVCNADCLGCISLQPSECCPSPQTRIDFTPTVDEIAEIGVHHLIHAPEPIISFGQGCEGEPSLAVDRLVPAIEKIRRQTSQGLINMNTNGGYTEGIRRIVDAGLDQMRISLISARPETHKAYYRSDYSVEDVRRTALYAKEKGVKVSVNMLLFPGLNDQLAERDAWVEFFRETRVDMVQLRNLNLDPDVLWQEVGEPESESPGVMALIRHLQEGCPDLQIGSFTHFTKE